MSNKKKCRQLLITQIISKQLVLSLTINLINVKIDLYLQWIFFFFFVHLYCFELCWFVIYKTGINDI